MPTEKTITPQRPLTEFEEDLLSRVADYRDELVTLLQDLVRINSVNLSAEEFNERGEIFTFAEKYMQTVGMETTLYKAPFTKGLASEYYYNLIAGWRGSEPGKTLQFNGHLDTVPFDEADWHPDTPPLGGVIKNNKLYGRGAMDMKAGIACQMVAMKVFKAAVPDFAGKLQLWLTPDEETHGDFGSAYMTKPAPGGGPGGRNGYFRAQHGESADEPDDRGRGERPALVEAHVSRCSWSRKYAQGAKQRPQQGGALHGRCKTRVEDPQASHTNVSLQFHKVAVEAVFAVGSSQTGTQNDRRS